MQQEERALAIDPGRAKCGLAVVCRAGRTIYRAVRSTETVLSEVETLLATYRPAVLVVGLGTGSKPLLVALEAANLPVPIERVDESYTSQEARARFVAENRPRGWQRLLPRCLRTPDCAYDDYVAVILAERYWQSAGR